MDADSHSLRRCNVGFYAQYLYNCMGSTERFPYDLLLRRLRGSFAGVCLLRFASLNFLADWKFASFCKAATTSRLLLRHFCRLSSTLSAVFQLQLLSFVVHLFDQVNCSWVTGKLHPNHAVVRLPSATNKPNVVRPHAAQMSLRNNGFPLAAWRMHCFCSDIRGVRQLQPAWV
ncbi:hypothetical protein BU25DRAFT_78238 [Macroventuria anomochaeta]|uniref:Uncharacterized protein n=1 Tax=Macroventuria anomochaeta TaxID=301207 RepID=A0ACB6SH49_9PLEO|nr:uncharacterized protein BU25DRAFT_78238 [Macroventuria anomochaeta]KAF2632589.1 hypothetical protein BU25DRAFT_78238 [Macroventuria anomochaeta]